MSNTQASAKAGYIYGFPMVDNYRVMHAYFVDSVNAEYKGGWNEVHNTARVYTPADTAIQTPNSDTPYSAVGADLRAEPLVVTVPEIEMNRYYSLQFIDLYTSNFAYVGSRTTGNGAGNYLLAGPNWSGEQPDGVDGVIHCDTELALILYRTQLFGSGDLDNVKQVQAGYRVQPLSGFLGRPAPAPAPAIDFVAPLTPVEQRTSPKFFEILDFALQFAPAVPEERELRARIASLDTSDTAACEAGMADAWAELNEFKSTKIDTGEVTSASIFGTREDLAGNYLYRFAAAALGIYGNTAAEAMYPILAVDDHGAPLTGAADYVVRFAPGQLPPVNSFWSLTMYEMPASQLVANPIDRYLINSPMLPELVADPDGGHTLYLQNASPGAGREANWLPAPVGPFAVVMRLYWPKPEALDGRWQAPKPVRT